MFVHVHKSDFQQCQRVFFKIFFFKWPLIVPWGKLHVMDSDLYFAPHTWDHTNHFRLVIF